MSKKNKKWVAFKGNSIIPWAVLGADDDFKTQAGEPINLPGDYADHVVADGFAVFCAAPVKTDAPVKSEAPVKPAASNRADEIANASKAAALAEAEKLCDDLDAQLDALEPGHPRIAELETQLDAAVAAHELLKAG